jgi:hypothetical protein
MGLEVPVKFPPAFIIEVLPPDAGQAEQYPCQRRRMYGCARRLGQDFLSAVILPRCDYLL